MNYGDIAPEANHTNAVITSIDLSQAVTNSVSGQREIVVSIFVHTNAATAVFFEVINSTNNPPIQVSIIPTNSISKLNLIGPIIPQLVTLPAACAGIIIAIMVLIVSGIIIYILIKTCNRLLPPTKKS
jgi:hypothetical protein